VSCRVLWRGSARSPADSSRTGSPRRSIDLLRGQRPQPDCRSLVSPAGSPPAGRTIRHRWPLAESIAKPGRPRQPRSAKQPLRPRTAMSFFSGGCGRSRPVPTRVRHWRTSPRRWTPSTCRLVARMRRPGKRGGSPRPAPRMRPGRCSQVVKHQQRLPVGQCCSDSVATADRRPDWSSRPTPRATLGGEQSRSRRLASSTSQTPSGKSRRTPHDAPTGHGGSSRFRPGRRRVTSGALPSATRMRQARPAARTSPLSSPRSPAYRRAGPVQCSTPRPVRRAGNLGSACAAHADCSGTN